MVVYTALEQRRAAVRLTKEMQAVLGETPVSKWRRLMCLIIPRECSQGSSDPAVEMGETRSRSHRYPWTHVHNFYAMMGGFAFSTSLIPDLSKDEIRDKSKTDGLAKSLVCLQVGWFFSPCVVRLAPQQVISSQECCVQIARLPLAAYEIPNWSYYFPHIG